jgi:hypothetical protein
MQRVTGEKPRGCRRLPDTDAGYRPVPGRPRSGPCEVHLRSTRGQSPETAKPPSPGVRAPGSPSAMSFAQSAMPGVIRPRCTSPAAVTERTRLSGWSAATMFAACLLGCRGTARWRAVSDGTGCRRSPYSPAGNSISRHQEAFSNSLSSGLLIRGHGTAGQRGTVITAVLRRYCSAGVPGKSGPGLEQTDRRPHSSMLCAPGRSCTASDRRSRPLRTGRVTGIVQVTLIFDLLRAPRSIAGTRQVSHRSAATGPTWSRSVMARPSRPRLPGRVSCHLGGVTR